MTVTLTRDGDVGIVSLDRAEALNAVTIELIAELDEALQKLTTDGARSCVLTGRGKSFSAGADLGLVKRAFEGEPAAVLGPLVDGLHATIRRIATLPFPVVAAIEGPAVGAGMGLALSADLRVVGKRARLVPGYFGIGSSPDGGVSYFLTRSLGRPRALALIMRNQPVDSARMLEWGLADEVVEDGAALEAATALAQTLTNVPPLALVRTRALIDSATGNGLSAHLDAEREGVVANWTAADFAEGVGAFLDRRTPRFTGS